MFDVYFAFHMKLRKLHFFWKGVARDYDATLFYALDCRTRVEIPHLHSKYAMATPQTTLVNHSSWPLPVNPGWISFKDILYIWK